MVNTWVKCPNCNTAVPWLSQSQFKPFCSERCKMIDFGEWVMQEKIIPGNPQPEDLDSDGHF